jgi:hypothetical protein
VRRLEACLHDFFSPLFVETLNVGRWQKNDAKCKQRESLLMTMKKFLQYLATKHLFLERIFFCFFSQLTEGSIYTAAKGRSAVPNEQIYAKAKIRSRFLHTHKKTSALLQEQVFLIIMTVY